MRTSRFIAAIAVAAVLAASSAARAETTTLDAMRESAHAVESRENVIHARAERASPEIRREAERVLTSVAKHRRALSVRLDLLEMLGRAAAIDHAALQEMNATVDTSHRLLDLVEKWLGTRP